MRWLADGWAAVERWSPRLRHWVREEPGQIVAWWLCTGVAAMFAAIFIHVNDGGLGLPWGWYDYATLFLIGAGWLVWILVATVAPKILHVSAVVYRYFKEQLR